LPVFFEDDGLKILYGRFKKVIMQDDEAGRVGSRIPFYEELPDTALQGALIPARKDQYFRLFPGRFVVELKGSEEFNLIFFYAS